jgi:CRP-like cAMP-binding protein
VSVFSLENFRRGIETREQEMHLSTRSWTVGKGSERRGRVASDDARVLIFDADPALIADIPKARREQIRQLATASLRALDPGPWEPSVRAGETLIAFLVLDGALLHERRLFGALPGLELLGPGSAFGREVERPPDALPYRPTWKVAVPSRVAVLTADLGVKATWMPEVTGALVARASVRAQTLINQVALMGIHDLNKRLHGMLWHLAESWGRHEDDGTILDVPLTQDMLADLVRSRRTTVNGGVRILREMGLVETPRGRPWVLFGLPPRSVEDLAVPLARRRPA